MTPVAFIGVALLVATGGGAKGGAPAPAAAAATTSALEKCRALDKEFDTKNMPKSCQAAADDATLSIPDRVEALRRLASAHIVNGDEALAEPAFLKMLVFSPATELPADAGPRFREIFVDVKKRFDAEGALATTFTPPAAPAGSEAVQLSIDLGDKLGRVVGARVKATSSDHADAPLEERLVRNELSPGQLRLTGAVPEPPGPVPAAGRTVTYDVTFDGWDGTAVAAPTPVHGEYSRGVTAAGAGAGDDGGNTWLFVGVGSAAGLALVGGVVGGVVWCYTAGPCRTQEAWVRVQIHQVAE